MNVVDVRSDFCNRQHASGKVTAKNVNIIADEADGAGSGALAISPFALEFGANQTSPWFLRTFFHRPCEYGPGKNHSRIMVWQVCLSHSARCSLLILENDAELVLSAALDVFSEYLSHQGNISAAILPCLNSFIVRPATNFATSKPTLRASQRLAATAL